MIDIPDGPAATQEESGGPAGRNFVARPPKQAFRTAWRSDGGYETAAASLVA
ncbi:hypothetical protein [Streptomyces sp. NPDC060027]|uniref:hypothetical protein n=1 Tax=Streptomyces sp. NPDC060027 TaxID=3347040 RepID=UPI0036844CA5